MLAFVQEVPTNGNDRVTNLNSAAHNGVLTVKPYEFDRAIRYGRGSWVEEPHSRALSLIIDCSEWNRYGSGRLRLVQVDGYGRSERRSGRCSFQHITCLKRPGERIGGV